jgi:hypothetical protein
MSSFGGISGPMQGAPFIGYDTGIRNVPHYITLSGTALTTTATRAYYAPFFVAEPVTFASAVTWNQGAGDNGDTYRIAIYANDGTAGPGTLIQDVGQVTLTGAAATRTLSVAINLQAYSGRWVWLMFHANQAAAMEDMRTENADGVYRGINVGFGTFGDYVAGANAIAVFRCVDTAYGAAASTAVTPTDSLTTMPAIALVK